MTDLDLSQFREFWEALGAIAPHDPDRYQTVDYLDNPDCTNEMRAKFAGTALEAFQRECSMEEDIDVAASDLVADLLHLVHSGGHDPRVILMAGICHFLAEAGNVDSALE